MVGAVPLIRILAVFGVVRSIESGIQPVFLASGKPQGCYNWEFN